MYRSRKATAVFQHTNPLKEERFMKEWQVSKWSPLTKVYTQYNTWRMTSTPVLGLFIPPFTPKLIWGRRGQRPQENSGAAAREQPWHGAGPGAPRRPRTACEGWCPQWLHCNTSCLEATGHSLELCQASAGSGSWGRSPALQHWEALVYHLSRNFSMYSSARLESLH